MEGSLGPGSWCRCLFSSRTGARYTSESFPVTESHQCSLSSRPCQTSHRPVAPRPSLGLYRPHVTHEADGRENAPVICSACRETRLGNVVEDEIQPFTRKCPNCGGTDYTVLATNEDAGPVYRVHCPECGFERVMSSATTTSSRCFSLTGTPTRVFPVTEEGNEVSDADERQLHEATFDPETDAQ